MKSSLHGTTTDLRSVIVRLRRMAVAESRDVWDPGCGRSRWGTRNKLPCAMAHGQREFVIFDDIHDLHHPALLERVGTEHQQPSAADYVIDCRLIAGEIVPILLVVDPVGITGH